ncbi:hypothetical protein ACHQM5_018684 [Ranunculus cassubicifolius]
MEEKQENEVMRKLSIPKINMEDIKKASPYVIMSPRSILSKQTSVKANCLCSPTTHTGSFRCRHHRNSILTRSGGSVGSNLSELASSRTNLSDLASSRTNLSELASTSSTLSKHSFGHRGSGAKQIDR